MTPNCYIFHNHLCVYCIIYDVFFISLLVSIIYIFIIFTCENNSRSWNNNIIEH